MMKDKKINRGIKRKLMRTGLAAVMAVVFIAIVIGINIGVTLLTERFPSMNIDLTDLKTNTLSEHTLSVASAIDEPITIYILANERDARSNVIWAGSGIKYEQIPTLIDRLVEANPNITAEYVDLDTNPAFAQNYTESLATGQVIVQSEQRREILTINDFFSVSTDQQTMQNDYFSKVDGVLANALHLVTIDNIPIVTFLVGHNEMLTSSELGQLQSLLKSDNFEIVEANLLRGEIPENTQILFIGAPDVDYEEEEIKKIREFLSDSEDSSPRSLFYAPTPQGISLANLDAFLEEWGVSVGNGYITETDPSNIYGSDPTTMFLTAASTILTDGYYPYIITAYNKPIDILFTSNDNITVTSLWTSSDSCYILTDGIEENPETDSFAAATLSAKSISVGEVNTYRNVVIFGSATSLSDALIGSTTFSNRSYTRDLFRLLAGTSDISLNLDIEEVPTMQRDVVASQQTSFIVGIMVFTIGIPLLILAMGLVIFLRRRHL